MHSNDHTGGGKTRGGGSESHPSDRHLYSYIASFERPRFPTTVAIRL